MNVGAFLGYQNCGFYTQPACESDFFMQEITIARELAEQFQ
jgi:hypothetical protein